MAHSTAWLPRLLPEMPHWQPSPDVFFVLGDLLLDGAIAHPAQAEQAFLPLVDTAWSTYLARWASSRRLASPLHSPCSRPCSIDISNGCRAFQGYLFGRPELASTLHSNE
ncbi:hypothetical protein U5801_21270 [Lamprobacter modestohalophilus]|uniref:hypothetical protein n=1 Tax=Lamprobacter modestohalophilus TaxID=1064514 RepID=UPI002ADEB67E|nr:hypothetical protein [Lamprobacter modestohalophilus]MEA1052315.1 hypothetical protein [Lamprobacter modestohalophilus]